MRACPSGGLTSFSSPFPFVIACDKREAFAQGSEATKQSRPFSAEGFSGLLRCARNDGDQLMIIPRHADRARNIMIARCEFHAGAGSLLADGGAIELLPRCLVGRVGEAALVLQLGTTLLQ